MTITGKLTQPGGTLYIDGGQLSVAGEYRLQTLRTDGTDSYSSGYLKMINAADYVLVGGNFVTQCYSTQTGYMTAGVLELKGNFTQNYAYNNYVFNPSGTHKVILSGTTTQTVTFASAAAGASRFNILEIHNLTNSINLNSSIFVNNFSLQTNLLINGDLTFTGGTIDL